MRLRIRHSLAVVAVALTVLPPSAHAAPLAISAEFLNSNLTFGGPGFLHEGNDVENLEIFGVDYIEDFLDTTFTASGGTLVQTTPVLDGGGNLARTDYRYEGGTFTVEFRDQPFNIVGLFTGPIDSLVIQVSEPLTPGGSGGFRSKVDAYYDLDAGMFDAAMASLLGIPQPTGPSSLGFADMGLLSGDHTSSELEADDGVLDLDVESAAVPEPPQALLAAAGLLAAYVTRFKRPGGVARLLNRRG